MLLNGNVCPQSCEKSHVGYKVVNVPSQKYSQPRDLIVLRNENTRHITSYGVGFVCDIFGKAKVSKSVIILVYSLKI